ncbi:MULTISPECIES: flagellar basal-body rod protein FlgG [Hydrogenophaga]|jgi:flagellar basal-body rod protein FlgG|uniref:Flagellar basal-body rod protein FlgF n=1 Tax=Hydrogenophaga aromaticivorans TaxID=2610898 RepID=A0A7Y8GU40_9BURK|nr:MULTISPECIES: flagellar basal-body rod protein FlgG [Hydrogenophaga]MBU4184154.1 flagellar basal-body rod protein FlgG [Gammaproteobacteria bacterium]MBW8468978.1 flagellar basal-body rod protein FlgG [Thiobacillus sp.]OGA75066.1 MAG: flagellar basal body rod protein FlgG [Burkholderiales bacterium GWE1_65_30]OGA90895.1 MAG: flagellar basal body rod protein FlgG [Burkholderiales bacterium GWF1_66_17]OGB28498.1 MAG: flagellar basal body rod protein FlgG [Burkholderiales bacterium RIFCSPHIGHO
MINSLWISKTGMQAQQTQLDVISNNMANVSTNGFKRASAVFEDLMYQNLRQVGAADTEQNNLPTGLQIGLGVRTVATSRSFTQGSLQQSGNQLDLAINGSGFIQVALPDGTTGYTRDGSLQVDAQGRLVTASGLPVAGDITIPAEAQSVTVGNDGVVTVKLPGNAQPQQVGNIELASFVNPAGLEPRGGNLYTETVASGNPVNGAPGSAGLGTLMQGYVETSNVNVVQELVTMIQTQRAYEMNSKAIQTSDQMLQRLGQL